MYIFLYLGVQEDKLFEADPNLQYTYAWDRLNVYRQRVYGVTTANIKVNKETKKKYFFKNVIQTKSTKYMAKNVIKTIEQNVSQTNSKTNFTKCKRNKQILHTNQQTLNILKQRRILDFLILL